MLRVMTLVGTRPELIKMSRVISELDAHFEHVLVHSGQNYDYELNQVFFDNLNIRKPDYFLDCSGDTPAYFISEVITKSDELFDRVRPDALLLYGDTNTCLAVISAKRRKIPVFHMEAGNRCFDERVPEELNRKVVDHLSDINMVLTEHARRYLIQEGLPQDRIIKTGSHMLEVINYYRNEIHSSDILERLSLKSGEYFLVSLHREENVDSRENLENFFSALNLLCNEYNFPIIVSTHPRTRKRIQNHFPINENPLLIFSKPFGYMDYMKLQIESLCVISDSGTITEESSLLDIPAITVRNAHERPEGMDEGVLIMSGLEPESVLDSVKIVVSQRNNSDEHSGSRFSRVVPDYDVPSVSKKVVRIVQSYTGYVNRVVWKKSGS